MLAIAAAATTVAAGCTSDSGHDASVPDRDALVEFDTRDEDPDWSPTDDVIAFVSNRGNSGIYLVRADGTELRLLYEGEAHDVDWSPDGKQIAFEGAHGIYVLDTAATETNLVLRGDDFSHPAWAPNGRELAVVKQEPGEEAGTLHDAIYLSEADGTNLHRLLPIYRGAVANAAPGSIASLTETDPTWSPDGTRIAFRAGDGVIVSADIKTGKRVAISSPDGGEEPAWSPDGRQIAYTCVFDLCLALADGTGHERLVATDATNPAWAPDSATIVFERELDPGGHDAYPQALLVVGRGGTLRTLTYGPTP